MATSYLDNYYARLGVPRSAVTGEIRKAYHKAARRLHPDVNKDPGAQELFLQIQEAYETLMDPLKRSEYDQYLPTDIDPPPEIMVNAIYSRAVLPIIDKPQLVYILLDMMAMPTDENLAIGTAPPLNVCLVLDTSTSMRGARLDMVKTTAFELVRSLKEQDIISVISFNDRPEVVVPASRGLERHRIESRISMLQARGGTEIFPALQAGFDQVIRFISPSYLNNIILITDGRTYGDEEQCLGLAERAAQRGITINGIGIGHEWNDEFVDELAKKTGGNSVFAPKARHIKKLLEKQFKTLTQTYANNVILDYTTPANIELRYAFRLSPETGSLPISTPLNIGSIPIGPRLSIIMEFMIENVPPNSDTVTLLEGTLKMDVPSRAIPSTTSVISLTRQTAMNPDLAPPPQVLIKAMSKLSLYRMQQQARQDIAEGNTNKAATRLQNLATQLLITGQPSLAQTVMLELKNLEGGTEIGAENEKRIKYGTRALLLPSGLEELDL
jgi:Ca-activated chloride channel family protein